ncbi:Transcription elongation factor [Balamuthia mandrillaris]
MEELVTLKRKLERSVEKEDDGTVLDVLKVLQQKTELINRKNLEVRFLNQRFIFLFVRLKGVTLPNEQQTRVGRAVGKLRKHSNAQVSELALQLVQEWKKLVGKAEPQARGKTEEAASSSNKKNENGNNKKEVGKANGSHKDGRETKKSPTRTTSTSAVRPSTLGQTRQTIVDMLVEALSEGSEDKSNENFALVAEKIEEQMYELYNHDLGKDYKAKFRTLYMNLKNPKNGELREEVLSDNITAHHLVRMTTEELAPQETRERKRQIEEYMLKEATRGRDPVATTDMWRCGKCKERKCTFYQLQTRSADEPMTTFVTCTVCGNRWKC